jgi:hypothetical protein
VLHDHEGFTTFSDIKVFVIMKRHRKYGQSGRSEREWVIPGHQKRACDDWPSRLTGCGPTGY